MVVCILTPLLFRLAGAFIFPAHGFKVFDMCWLEVGPRPDDLCHETPLSGYLLATVSLTSPQHGDILVTLGSEEPGYLSATLKLWDCHRLEALASSSAGAAMADADAPSAQRIPTPATALLRSSKLFGPKYLEAEVRERLALCLSVPFKSTRASCLFFRR